MNNKRIINNIQLLRAFAAINVVVFHIIGTAHSYHIETGIFNFLEGWGKNGVDLFFVISGFVIYHSYKNKESTMGQFLLARYIRIAPIYYILTSVFVALILIAPNLFRSFSLNSEHLLSSYLFISNLTVDKNPILYLGWTLEWEMFFYLMFSVIFLFKKETSYLIFLIITLLTVALLFSETLIALEFFLGVIIAKLYQHKTTIRYAKTICTFGIITLCISLFFEINIDRFFIYGIPSAIIVLGALYMKQIKNKVFIFLGNASYSIYLIQVFTISAFYKIILLLPFQINGTIATFMCLFLTVLSGSIFYIIVEKPIHHYLKNYLK